MMITYKRAMWTDTVWIYYSRSSKILLIIYTYNFNIYSNTSWDWRIKLGVSICSYSECWNLTLPIQKSSPNIFFVIEYSDTLHYWLPKYAPEVKRVQSLVCRVQVLGLGMEHTWASPHAPQRCGCQSNCRPPLCRKHTIEIMSDGRLSPPTVVICIIYSTI